MTKRISIFTLTLSSLLITCGCVPAKDGVPQIVGSAPHTRIQIPDVPQITTTAMAAPPAAITKLNVQGIPAAWSPPAYLENKARWKGIIIHHSDASYGSAAHEDKVHRLNGWGGLGYNFIINNGIFNKGYGEVDGLVEVGDRWRQQKTGAHCRPKGDRTNYWNEHTIGICLIGDFEKNRPTQKQMRSLVKLVRFLKDRYNIPLSKIQSHRDIKPTKCPGRYFPMAKFKQML